jgi:negative regulator of sigma E activity
MKRIAISAGLAAAAATLSLSTASPIRDPVDVLVSQASTAPGTLTYSGVVQSIVFDNDNAEAVVYRIEHRAPDVTERVYLAPEKLKGNMVLVRGARGYFVDPKRHRVVETLNDAVLDPVDRAEDYALVRLNYRTNARSDESFDGRRVKVVGLTNKYTGTTTMVMRIDRSTKLVLDRQEYSVGGTLLSETRFQEVRFAASLPDADFQLPGGYTTVNGPQFGTSTRNVSQLAGTAGFAARVPKSLPEGFAAIEGHVSKERAGPTVHVLYSDGIRTVSIFENANGSSIPTPDATPTHVGHNDGEYLQRGRNMLLTWNDGTRQYTLVGDVGIDELKKLAASLTP